MSMYSVLNTLSEYAYLYISKKQNLQSDINTRSTCYKGNGPETGVEPTAFMISEVVSSTTMSQSLQP